MGIFGKLFGAMKKTKDNLSSKLRLLFAKNKLFFVSCIIKSKSTPPIKPSYALKIAVFDDVCLFALFVRCKLFYRLSLCRFLSVLFVFIPIFSIIDHVSSLAILGIYL